jgi:hypothetical protein
MDDNFQFWSSPVLDLSLDSFSTEIFQEFDKGVNENNSILTNQFIMENDAPTIITSTEPTNEGEDFISASPTSSSSVSLPEVEEDEEEEALSETPVIEEDIEDVPASIHVSRQSSTKSAASKLETTVSEDNDHAPSESADNTGVQQEEPVLQHTYTSKEVMSAQPIAEPVSSAAPKKSLFSCFSFC